MPSHEELKQGCVAGANAGDDFLITEATSRSQKMSAFTHLDQFLGHARFSTWLTRIAVHEALHRVKRKRRLTGLEDGGESLESPEAGPEKRAFYGELRQILEAAIDRVPEGYRTVFILREVEGLSTADTAACLSIPEETVKTRLHRARQQLQRQIDQALGTALQETFSFGFERCDRLVAAVLRRLPSPDASDANGSIANESSRESCKSGWTTTPPG